LSGFPISTSKNFPFSFKTLDVSFAAFSWEIASLNENAQVMRSKGEFLKGAYSQIFQESFSPFYPVDR
jgi:hypothetical protein